MENTENEYQLWRHRRERVVSPQKEDSQLFEMDGQTATVTLHINTLTVSTPRQMAIIPLGFQHSFEAVGKGSLFGIRIAAIGKRDMHFLHANPSVVDRWVGLLHQRIHKIGFYEDYQPLKVLGSGSSAKVYLTARKRDGVRVAVKAFHKADLKPDDRDALQNQLRVSKLVDHQCIVKLIGSYETEKSYYLVSELAEGLSLDHYLQGQQRLSKQEARHVFKQTARAVRYMTRRGLIHRDIKPENIIYHSKTQRVCLIDLGLSSFCDQSHHLYPNCGTAGYAAPEVLQSGQANITPLLDVFSLGVLLHLLLFGKMPYASSDLKRLIHANRLGKIHFSSSLIPNSPEHVLLTKMLAEQTRRISIEKVFECEFMKEGTDPLRTADKQSLSRKMYISSRPREMREFSIFDRLQPAACLKRKSTHQGSKKSLERSSCFKTGKSSSVISAIRPSFLRMTRA